MNKTLEAYIFTGTDIMSDRGFFEILVLSRRGPGHARKLAEEELLKCNKTDLLNRGNMALSERFSERFPVSSNIIAFSSVEVHIS